MAIKWGREDIQKFIVCMQQYPCIYSVKSLGYMDRTMKAQAFNKILLEMEENMPGISLQELKKKWRNLRTQFMQEERLVYRSMKSGSGRDDLYVPKLWCYDQLGFLKNHIVTRPSCDNVEVNINCSLGCSFVIIFNFFRRQMYHPLAEELLMEALWTMKPQRYR